MLLVPCTQIAYVLMLLCFSWIMPFLQENINDRLSAGNGNGAHDGMMQRNEQKLSLLGNFTSETSSDKPIDRRRAGKSLLLQNRRKRKRALESHRKVNKNFLSSVSFRCSWEGPLCHLSTKGCAPQCQNTEDALQPGETEVSWYSVAIKAMVQGFGCLQMQIHASRDSLKCPKRLSLCSWQDLWTWKCLGGCKAPVLFPPLLELLFYLPPGASLWVRSVTGDSSTRNWKRKTEVRQPSSLAFDLLFKDRAANTSCLWFGFRDGTLCGAVTSIHSTAVPGPAEGENEARLDVVLQDTGSILKRFQKGVCRSFGAGKVPQQIVLTWVRTPFGPLLPVPTLS